MADAPTTPLNILQDDYSLSDALQLLKQDILVSLNCVLVGTIQSFDATTQTCTVTINFLKEFFQANDAGVYGSTTLPYPLLIDVPVFVVTGGPSSLRLPIAEGDECILLFNDKSLDDWYSSGQVVAPSSFRKHSVSDAIALVGIKSSMSAIENYDPAATELGTDTIKLRVDDVGASLNKGDTIVRAADKVKIQNSLQNLNTLLQNLITAINAIATTNAVVGSPCLISPASQAALSNIATEIAELLE